MSNADIKAFEPKAFMDSGDSVIVHLHLEYTVKKTGKSVKEDQLQWWTLDRQGKINGLMHFEDTAQVVKAWGS